MKDITIEKINAKRNSIKEFEELINDTMNRAMEYHERYTVQATRIEAGDDSDITELFKSLWYEKYRRAITFIGECEEHIKGLEAEIKSL